MAIKISIITVTYNAAAVLRPTMESVACQTYGDVEHLVIDGASTDGTVEIAREYANARVVSEPDHGLYDAMNKGLRLATGDYVCFLNAGDRLHSTDTIAHIASRAASSPHQVCILYGHTDIVDSEGRFLRRRRLQPPPQLTWRSFKDGMLVCHQSFYVLRSIAPTYDLRYRFSADFDWCIRCMKEGERRGMVNVMLDEPLADYLNEGMTTTNHRASLLERFRVMARHYGLFTTVAQHVWFIFRAIIKK